MLNCLIPLAKVVQGETQEGDHFEDARTELPTPTLLAATDLPSAQEQSLSSPTPPGPSYEFHEPEDTTGQVI